MAIGNIKRWMGFSAPSPSMLRLQFEREGFSVFQWTDRIGTNYGWHTHPEDQAHWIISGELEITVDLAGKYQTYTLKAGDRDLVEANVYHKARVIGNSDVMYLVGAKRKIEEPRAEEVAPETKTKTTKPKTAKTKKTTAPRKKKKG